MKIREISFHSAGEDEREDGLLGWIALSVDDRLKLASIALRRTLDGRLTLSFPARRDGAGRQHFYIKPLNDETRRAIEAEVFRQLGLEPSVQ